MTSLLRLLPAELDQLMLRLDAPRYRADQLLDAIYRGDATAIDELRQLPAALRERLADEGFRLALPTPARSVVSEDGETTKVLLRFDDGTLIESVLMQYPGQGRHPRSTVCVSSQAGCAMGCVFCATGQMGFERNLRAEEIVAQVLVIQRLLRHRGQHVTNVVFMGMGEPLANYNETIRAIRLLVDSRAFGLSHRAITVSTVGIIRGIDRLAAENLQVRLAISLHAPNDALRRRLVPVAAPQSVREIVAAARRYYRRGGRRVTIEYALIDGVNDRDEHAHELAALLHGIGIHVNLIPLNPTGGAFRRPSRSRVLAFQRILQAAGVNCTVRVEKGAEISAACGQLRTGEARNAQQAPATPSAAAPRP